MAKSIDENILSPVAGQPYYSTYPILSNGQKSVYASDENPGTKIVIHE